MTGRIRKIPQALACALHIFFAAMSRALPFLALLCALPLTGCYTQLATVDAPERPIPVERIVTERVYAEPSDGRIVYEDEVTRGAYYADEGDYREGYQDGFSDGRYRYARHFGRYYDDPFFYGANTWGCYFDCWSIGFGFGHGFSHSFGFGYGMDGEGSVSPILDIRRSTPIRRSASAITYRGFDCFYDFGSGGLLYDFPYAAHNRPELWTPRRDDRARLLRRRSCSSPPHNGSHVDRDRAHADDGPHLAGRAAKGTTHAR